MSVSNLCAVLCCAHLLQPTLDAPVLSCTVVVLRRVFTLIVTAGISALLFVLAVYTPGKYDQNQLLAYQNSMLRHNNRWVSCFGGGCDDMRLAQQPQVQAAQ